MKTIYSSITGKVKISDEVLSLVDRAARRVYEISKEDKWVPSIEITLKKGKTGSWHPGHPTGDLIIRVDIDSWTDDNVHMQMQRALRGKLPANGVRADLGDYGYEGWQSAIECNDLRELPDPYFEDRYVHRLLNLFPPLAKERYKEIEKQHWNHLARLIYNAASQDLGSRKKFADLYSSEEAAQQTEYLERVAASSHNFGKGKISLERLIKTLQDRPKIKKIKKLVKAVNQSI